MIQFTADRLHVQRILQGMKSTIKEKVYKFGLIECELSVTSTDLTFSIPGAAFTVPCKGNGAATAIFPIVPFVEVMKLENRENIEMKIAESQVTLGTFSFSAKTIFFANDRVLRIIKLPKNYSFFDLITVTKSDYTQEELEYNKIPEKIAAMQDGLGKAIKSCFHKLKQFGIQFNDIEEFVMSKFYK